MFEALAIALLAMAAPQEAADQDNVGADLKLGIRIVVHAKNPIQSLQAREVSKIFLRQRRSWPWSEAELAHVASLPGSGSDETARNEFFGTRIDFARRVR